ncbi:hypothetical protein AVEN_218188-1, partial [Araneus ventricosus]
EKSDSCVLGCPVSTNCVPQTCCGSIKDGKSDAPMKQLGISSLKNGALDNVSMKGVYRTYDSSNGQEEKL